MIEDSDDKCFNLQSAWKAFEKFKKVSILSDDEISISSVSRFDAIVTTAVDSFESDFPSATPDYNEFNDM